MNSNGNRPSACLTCRRRRVKCDQVEPACERCSRAKIQCEGYTKDLKFVDEKGRAQRRVQVKREAYLQSVQAELEKSKAVREHNQGQSKTQIMPEISLTAFQEQIEMSHMDARLFAGAKNVAPWIMDHYDGSGNCTTSTAMRALGSMYFARKFHSKQSLDQSMIYYSKALRLLGSDLQHSKHVYETRSLSNVLTLCIFEMMASTSGLGLIGHQCGVQRLVEAWKPQRFQKFPENLILDAARFAIGYIHIDQRKRCFLEQEQWLSIPWANQHEDKSLCARLGDRLVQVPGLLEDMEKLRVGHPSTQSPDFVSLLFSRVQTQLHNLYTWRAAWEIERGPCCVAKPSKDPNVPFSTILHFNDLTQGFQIALYNTILLILCRIGRILTGPSFSPILRASTPPSRTNIALLRPSDPKTVQDIAREILRIIEFGLSEPHTSAGCFQMLFPLRSALEVFKPDSPEWKYMTKCFADIADIGGFEISRSIMPDGLCGRLLQDEYINT